MDAVFGIQPGRPGPNRLVIRLSSPAAAGVIVELDLQRLDSDHGVARLTLRAAPSSAFGPAGRVFVADGGQLGASTRWDVAAQHHHVPHGLIAEVLQDGLASAG